MQVELPVVLVDLPVEPPEPWPDLAEKVLIGEIVVLVVEPMPTVVKVELPAVLVGLPVEPPEPWPDPAEKVLLY